MTVNITTSPVFVVTEKSLPVAYILLFLLGFFGAHHFYIGKIGRGLLYFLTAGFFGLAVIWDLFTLPSQVRLVNTQRRVGIR
jgi:TM2 domain-containing membrane protein YozV